MYSGVYALPRIERVVFGRPAAEVVLDEARRADARRVFILAPAVVVEKTDIVGAIVRALGERHAGTWTDVSPHTPREDVIAAAAAAREAGAQLLVTVGGGSITDAAKLVQTCLANDITRAEQLDEFRKRPDESMTAERPGMRAPQVRTVAVPTTLAGAEFTPYAGITNMQRGVKEVFTHPLQVPRTIVLDPAAAVHTPARCGCPPASARWTMRWRTSAPSTPSPTRRARRCRRSGCWRKRCPPRSATRRT